VGFQLVDRNDDNTKAMGVFGFQLGKRWVYVPMFFINNDLKGHEMMWLKEQDLFLPLQDRWVDYLLARRPYELGEGSSQTAGQLGARQPDLRRLSVHPQSNKYGSYSPDAMPDWAKQALPGLAAAGLTNPLRKHAGLAERLDLRTALASDLRLVKVACDWVRQCPQLKTALAQFYPPSLLADALVSLRSQALKQASVLDGATVLPPVRSGWRPGRSILDESTKQAVEVKIKEDATISGDVSAEDDEEVRERIARDGYLIDDKRTDKETSRAYNTQVRMALVNPTATGLYQVLTKEGDFEEMLVVAEPHSGDGRRRFVTVVDPSGDKGWLNADRAVVWTRSEDTSEHFRDWIETQAKPSELEKGGIYLAISLTGQGSVPFKIVDSVGEGVFEVAYADETDYYHRVPEYMPVHRGHHPNLFDRGHTPPMIRLNDREGTSFRSTGGTLYLPAECRILRLADPRPREEVEDNECGCMPSVLRWLPGASEDPPIRPGDLSDLQLMILQKTASLKIIPAGSEMLINDLRLTKRSALFHLVCDHGFRETAAKALLKQAEARRGARFRVKYAEGYGAGPYQPSYNQSFEQYETGQGPGAAYGFPEPNQGQEGGFGQYASTYPQEEQIPVPALQAQNTDQTIYDMSQPPPEPISMQVAQQAAGNGQKEVFDTAVLGNLLKTVRDESLVDRYLGDLLKALDRTLRMLFLFYWHGEQFQDRYGKADMPELEDTLRNAAEVLGDLVLFLKTKTVGPESRELGPADIDESAQL
jgi:hypothetical protein